VLSVLIAAPVAGDGESNWLKGVALLPVYLSSLWPSWRRRAFLDRPDEPRKPAKEILV
jgi:hypothetical protein